MQLFAKSRTVSGLEFWVHLDDKRGGYQHSEVLVYVISGYVTKGLLRLSRLKRKEFFVLDLDNS
jgi:hypothetical protein